MATAAADPTLTRGPFTEEEKAKVLELKRKGMGVADIAREVNRHYASVLYIIEHAPPEQVKLEEPVAVAIGQGITMVPRLEVAEAGEVEGDQMTEAAGAEALSGKVELPSGEEQQKEQRAVTQRAERPWTDEERARLWELVRVRKLTWGAAAHELGRARGALSYQLKVWEKRLEKEKAKERAGRPWTKAELDEALQMRGHGVPGPKIAKALGRSVYAVRKKIETYLAEQKLSPELRAAAHGKHAKANLLSAADRILLRVRAEELAKAASELRDEAEELFRQCEEKRRASSTFDGKSKTLAKIADGQMNERQILLTLLAEHYGLKVDDKT